MFGFEYVKAKKDKYHLMNVVLGQSKMAMYVSRRRRLKTVWTDVVLLLSRMIKARILIDLNFY